MSATGILQASSLQEVFLMDWMMCQIQPLRRAWANTKKTEIEGLGDGKQTHYFFETQCNADRPAWILESPESG